MGARTVLSIQQAALAGSPSDGTRRPKAAQMTVAWTERQNIGHQSPCPKPSHSPGLEPSSPCLLGCPGAQVKVSQERSFSATNLRFQLFLGSLSCFQTAWEEPCY